MVCHSAATDQVQFLDPSHIDQLRHIVSVWKIPVIAYGLRTDFRTNFFPGSSRLMELADNIEEVNSTFACVGCSFFERFSFYEAVEEWHRIILLWEAFVVHTILVINCIKYDLLQYL
jgi:Thymidine kinase